MTELVSKALPLAGAAAGYALAPATGGASLALSYAGLGASLGGAVSSVFSAQAQNRLAANAAAQQQAAMATQTAVQNRQTIAASTQAGTTDLQSADILRATAAGRRNSGGLAYGGPTTALKTTFGG